MNPLTPRQREILALIATGRKNARIASLLGITEQTVKHLTSQILDRLAVHDRTGAVVVAHQRGWLDLTEVEVSRR